MNSHIQAEVELRSGVWALAPASMSGMLRALSSDTVIRSPQQPGFAAKRSRNVVTIPVCGALTQRPTVLARFFGGTATEQVSAELRAAVEDETVAAVVLDVDSAGGSTFGVMSLAAEIRAARAKKPVAGIANSIAASAAYWLLAQCSDVYVAPNGQVGGLGAVVVHEDVSRSLDKAGIKISLIHAGRHKVEGNGFEALGAEARRFMQSRVDDIHAAMTADIARGRGIAPSVVASQFGQGRLLGADQALTAGMVDGVATLPEVIARLGARRAGPGAGRSSSASQQPRLAMARRHLDLLQ